jgi:hypothetical protein
LALFSIALVNLGLHRFLALALNSKSVCPLGEVEVKYEVGSPKFIWASYAQLYSLAERPRNPPPLRNNSCLACIDTTERSTGQSDPFSGRSWRKMSLVPGS